MNRIRVLAEINCGADGCETTTQVLTFVNTSMFGLSYRYGNPTGWRFDENTCSYLCPLHPVAQGETK